MKHRLDTIENDIWFGGLILAAIVDHEFEVFVFHDRFQGDTLSIGGEYVVAHSPVASC